MEKRFFWLKLRETFFSDTYIKAMRTLPNGDSLVLAYLEMALYSLKANGIIEYEELMPSLVEEIALAINEPVELTAQTIDLLIKFRAAELDGNKLCLTEMMKHMGSEQTSTERVQKFRERKKQLETADETFQPVSNVTTEKEIEKEKEKESELEQYTPLPPQGETPDCAAIVEQFNSVCTALPKVIDISAPRKKAIGSALKKLGKEGLTELFQKTAASDFLCGKKGGWKASFDWIMKPENLTKIIEGNFDNAKPPEPEATSYCLDEEFAKLIGLKWYNSEKN